MLNRPMAADATTSAKSYTVETQFDVEHYQENFLQSGRFGGPLRVYANSRFRPKVAVRAHLKAPGTSDERGTVWPIRRITITCR